MPSAAPRNASRRPSPRAEPRLRDDDGTPYCRERELAVMVDFLARNAARLWRTAKLERELTPRRTASRVLRRRRPAGAVQPKEIACES